MVYKWYFSCQLGDGLCHRSHLLGEPASQPFHYWLKKPLGWGVEMVKNMSKSLALRALRALPRFETSCIRATWTLLWPCCIQHPELNVTEPFDCSKTYRIHGTGIYLPTFTINLCNKNVGTVNMFQSHGFYGKQLLQFGSKLSESVRITTVTIVEELLLTYLSRFSFSEGHVKMYKALLKIETLLGTNSKIDRWFSLRKLFFF